MLEKKLNKICYTAIQKSVSKAILLYSTKSKLIYIHPSTIVLLDEHVHPQPFDNTSAINVASSQSYRKTQTNVSSISSGLHFLLLFNVN